MNLEGARIKRIKKPHVHLSTVVLCFRWFFLWPRLPPHPHYLVRTKYILQIMILSPHRLLMQFFHRTTY